MRHRFSQFHLRDSVTSAACPRYRLSPTPAQVSALSEPCGHARYVWNLAVEQHLYWSPGRKSAPGFAEQCRQLTEARGEFEWLRSGSIIVQQ
ncbi:helix-turn-helix domain-containing protein [Herbidospora cretacea]|uniref:helix-turn-helix domain-containing protein n=1 Tax=Herbidospora cretacea TaxID=28444 RepID=UPI003AFB292D